MEVYENHLGGIYLTDEVRPIDDLYCEVCGDSDWHIGHADTWEEVLDLITDDEGFCPYAEDYLAELKARFETERGDGKGRVMTIEEAMKYCEEHTCGECPCIDTRTKEDRAIGQIPCFYNLTDWRTEENHEH